jgi:peroxiredoxin Q/BCP
MRLLAKCVAACFVLGALGLVINGPASAVAQGKGKGKGKKKVEPKVELKVKVGEAAPVFESVDESGKPFKSSNVVGKQIVVLYFYPADFTGTGAAQARGFQEEMENLNTRGVLVVGVSGDSVSTHKLFKAYYKLPFTLLADERGEVAKLFGVPVQDGGKSPTINEKEEKGSADRGVTIESWTLVIDKAGTIAAADKVGKVSGDAKRVAEIVKKLDAK